MDKFNVLPTDERFMNLYDEQKLAMFEGICHVPDMRYLKKQVVIDSKIEELKKKELEAFGSPGLIKRMEMTFKASGLPEPEVKNKIKQYLTRLKEAELKNLEKMKNE